MRTFVLGWLGLNVAYVAYRLVRASIRDRREREAILRMNRIAQARREEMACAQIMLDLGLKIRKPKPRVTACEIAPHGIIESGVNVRAHCVEEAAEIIAQAPQFYPRSAA
jgi:hypothetical protein